MHTMFKDEYTRKVSGETFTYEAIYDAGDDASGTVGWRARVFLNGDLKGQPEGTVIDNALRGDALKQYVISYIENIIERGLGIAE